MYQQQGYGPGGFAPPGPGGFAPPGGFGAPGGFGGQPGGFGGQPGGFGQAPFAGGPQQQPPYHGGRDRQDDRMGGKSKHDPVLAVSRWACSASGRPKLGATAARDAMGRAMAIGRPHKQRGGVAAAAPGPRSGAATRRCCRTPPEGGSHAGSIVPVPRLCRWIKARSPKEKLYLGIAGGVIVSWATPRPPPPLARFGWRRLTRPLPPVPTSLPGAAAAVVCGGGPRHAVHPQRECALPGHWSAGLEADQEEGGRRCAGRQTHGSRSCGLAGPVAGGQRRNGRL